MKKIKTLVLAGATAATIAAPIAATVSCGSSSYAGRYNTKETDLQIMTSWAVGGTQYNALQKTVDAWNALGASTNKPANWRRMDITHVEGGYDAIRKNLSMSFEAHDSAKVPNLIIDYPDTLGTLAKYDMQETIADNAEDEKAIKDLIDPSFMKVNDEIGGLAAGKTYMLPMAKSIDMNTINYPVLAHVINGLQDKGWITFDTTGIDAVSAFADSNATARINAFKAAVAADKTARTPFADEATVQKIWNDATETGKPAAPVAMTFESIFNQGSNMLDFVTMAGKAFANKSQDAYIFGIDSATNFIYQSVFQKVNAEMKDFLFSKEETAQGYVKYNWESGKAKEAFTEVYNKLKAAMDVKAIYVNEGGAYSSSLETQHRIAFAFGSTAGYTHNYVAGNGEVLTFGSELFTSISADTAEVKAAKNTDSVASFGKYGNNIYKSTFSGDFKNPAYDIKSESADADQKIAAFIAAHPADTAQKTGVYVISNLDAAKIKDETQKVKVNDSKYLAVLKLEAHGSETLQQSEMDIINTTSKWDSNSTKASQLVQGPSMVAVHNNDAEDASMHAFIKWYMTDSTKPYLSFASSAHYIAPTADGLAKGKSSSYPNDKITALSLEKMTGATPSVVAFDNPADDTTGDFRSVLQTTIVQSFKQSIAPANPHALPVDEIYDRVLHG